MGLAEKRALEAFKGDYFQTWTQQFNQAAKYEPSIEIDWDSLVAGCHNADDMTEWFSKVYFMPLLESIKSICADDMGASALKDSMTKIIIQNKSGIYNGSKWASFDSGTLTLDHESATNVDSIEERTKGLTAVLENSL